MKRIQITIKNNTLEYKYSIKAIKDTDSLLNTNVINDGELIFSDQYINKNVKIVSILMKEIYEEENINEIDIESSELAEIVLKTLSKIVDIPKVNILDQDIITYALAEDLVKNNNVKSINCYSVPEYIVEYLDKYNIKVDSRSELFFTSNFMQLNDLYQYSKLFYKKKLVLPKEMLDVDYSDLEIFLKINKYLKTISLEVCDVLVIEKVITILKDLSIKNVKIIIHDNITNEDNIIKLRKLNKNNKNNIRISINYSKDYIKNNYLKQVIFNTVKVCSLTLLTGITITLGYITFNNISSYKSVESINNNVEKVVANTMEKLETEEVIEGEHGPTLLNELLSVNSDTVGWLTVNNTTIDYPIVQSIDNDYYLNNNYNKEHDYNGWLFMDYRNNIDEMSKNTIIYGHNRYSSKIMFGDLNKTSNKKWLSDEDNLVITFNTLYNEMKFQIFSVYTVKNTSDYIKTEFKSDNDYLDFLDLIQNRSEHDFDVVVSAKDKIITLSTCFENNKRYVVHAKMITE